MEIFIRICTICNKEIKYKNKGCYQSAVENNTKCKSCASIIRMSNPEAREKISKKVSGKNNPMYGKSFKDVWKEKYNQEQIIELEKQHSAKSIKGASNAMKGKIVYNVWMEKYGKEVADQKLSDMKSKISLGVSGENNPMYGKPSPKKSGSGWSGYYKDHYFRSILEFSYLIYLLENNINFESGEKKKYNEDWVKRNPHLAMHIEKGGRYF